MIQVEALERIKSDGYDLQPGDRVTIDDAPARIWCGAGWAKAVNGSLNTGKRRVVKAVLQPATAVHAQNADEVKNG